MKSKFKNIFALQAFVAIAFAIAIIGCKKVQDTEVPTIKLQAYKAGQSDGSIKKIASKRIRFTVIDTQGIINRYPEEIIGGIINNGFANPKAYVITKLAPFPQKVLTIATVNFVERTLYYINTVETIEVGKYHLKLEYQKGQFYEADFTVTEADSNDEIDEPGNYYEFIPSVVDFSNGVKLSVSEAEIGSPSFYVVKFSIDKTKLAASGITTPALETAIAVTNNHKLVLNGADSSPSVIKQSFITGYLPDATLNADLQPTHNSYDEVINGVTYQTTETLVYLSNMPEKDQVYSVKVNINNKTYQSGDFKFRFAFNSVRLKTFSSFSAKDICFVSTLSGRAKCVGGNRYLTTGYDTGLYNSANPYQLSFLPAIKNINDVVITEFATCAIYDYDQTYNVSKTKCWGSNRSGILGSGNILVGDLPINTPSISYNSPSFAGKENFFYTSAANAKNVTNPVGFNSLNINAIAGGLNFICGINQVHQPNCWGNYNLTQYIDTPDTRLGYYGSGYVMPIPNKFFSTVPTKTYYSNITKVSGGDGEFVFCMAATPDNGPQKLVCLDNNGSFQVIYATQANLGESIYQIASTEGSVCVLLQRAGQFFDDNVVCQGKSDNYELGVNTKSYQRELKLTSGRYLTQTAPGGGPPQTVSKVFNGKGTRFTCFITDQFKMKCAGESNNNFTVTNGEKEFYRMPFMDFGSGIDVIDGVGGDSLICVTLRTTIHKKDYYANKCWGKLFLDKFRYYNPYPNGNESNNWVHYEYIPVVRW